MHGFNLTKLEGEKDDSSLGTAPTIIGISANSKAINLWINIMNRGKEIS
jgi:hypothetical protein